MGDWKHPVFGDQFLDYCSDQSCCMSCCCPCIQMGNNAQEAEVGSCVVVWGLSCIGFYCCVKTWLRYVLRQKYGITKPGFFFCCDEANVVDDFFMALQIFLCWPALNGLVQESREIREQKAGNTTAPVAK